MDIILTLEMNTLSSEMDKYLNNQHALKDLNFCLILVIKYLFYQHALKDRYYISSIFSLDCLWYPYAQKDWYLMLDFVDVIFM